ncbi:MAG: hypothetical protein KCHDKBKB_03044 [Elusimicrobia bacterium]|nr:hypothetical protein [Elusimicrobiota bacterium]
MNIKGILLIETATAGGEFGEFDTIETTTRFGLFNSLPGGGFFSAPVEIVGAAADNDADGRFTVHTPLPCQVIYRIDTLDGDVEDAEWSEGTETTTTVTPGSPATVHLNAPGDFDSSRLMVIGLIWHPLA